MTTLAPVLTERYLPRLSARQRDLLLILSGSLLVALLAQVRISLPFTPVPITGQTMGVLLTGALLGSRRGTAALLLYLLEGLAGLPVFAGGAGGAAHLMGATGGYLLGFVLAAWLVGALCERGLERTWRTAWLPFLAGEALIYLAGVPWLAFFVGGMHKAVTLGLLPFLPGDALKAMLAAALLPAAWHWLTPARE
ncbi:MAG: biotin transporter BioY [Anaerolineales bacterium]